MADSVTITNLPKNEAQVGLDFYRVLRGRFKAPDLASEFALFAACVAAAKGHGYTVPNLSE